MQSNLVSKFFNNWLSKFSNRFSRTGEISTIDSISALLVYSLLAFNLFVYCMVFFQNKRLVAVNLGILVLHVSIVVFLNYAILHYAASVIFFSKKLYSFVPL